MNKTLKTYMIATLACLMLCGTALAAPRGGHEKGRAPNQARRHQTVRARPAPRQHAHKRRPAPARHHRHHRKHYRPPVVVRCCRYQHNVYDCLCCLPSQRVVIWW